MSSTSHSNAQSPLSLLAAAAVACLAVAALAVAIARSTPWLGIQAAADDHAGLSAVHVQSEGPNAALAARLEGTPITAFGTPTGPVAATPALLIDEPDLLPTFADYNALMGAQSALSAAARAGALTATLQGGEVVPLRATERPLGSLPLLFWFQLACGIGGALTGALVWGARRRDRAAGLYALTGLGYLVFAPAAAVYSTRELLLDGTTFRWLSAANHFGALLFTASLSALLWHYPRRLGRAPVAGLAYVAAFGVWLGDVLQLASPALFHLGVLAVFASSFVFAAAQWWATRGLPAERAALRWFLLSIYLATGLFAGAVIVPAALGLPVLASQGLMFGAFLLMYFGLALGIVRYRLFALERYWHAIVGWLIGGLCVAVLDAALMLALALPDSVALPLAVGITGWLYFPLRQWAWARWGRRRHADMSRWLPDVLPLLLEVPEDRALARLGERWSAICERVFVPTRVTPLDACTGEARIVDSGLGLEVPALTAGEAGFVLVCAERGARLFTTADLDTLRALRDLVELGLETYRARDVGAEAERERIRRDLHDDIGARLLTLLHASAPEHQHLVREALVDTRALVQTLELGDTDLETAAASWQHEAEQRCELAGVQLAWRAHAVDGVMLSARQIANLTRVLREALSNALRHAAPGHIEVDVEGFGEGVRLRIADDGNTPPLDTWSRGRGRRIMQQRAEEIGAGIEWHVAEGCTVELTLPAQGSVMPRGRLLRHTPAAISAPASADR